MNSPIGQEIEQTFQTELNDKLTELLQKENPTESEVMERLSGLCYHYQMNRLQMTDFVISELRAYISVDLYRMAESVIPIFYEEENDARINFEDIEAKIYEQEFQKMIVSYSQSASESKARKSMKRVEEYKDAHKRFLTATKDVRKCLNMFKATQQVLNSMSKRIKE